MEERMEISQLFVCDAVRIQHAKTEGQYSKSTQREDKEGRTRKLMSRRGRRVGKRLRARREGWGVDGEQENN